MICPKCLSEIPEDALYCDICGIKILICPTCNRLGTGKFCEVDNSKMIEKNIGPLKKKRGQKKEKAKNKHLIVLKNKNLNISIKINENGIIGRKSEIGSNELNRFPQISSEHASIEFKTKGKCFVTDLDTTNGTKLNGTVLKAMQPELIKSGDTLTLANIEFFVS